MGEARPSRPSDQPAPIAAPLFILLAATLQTLQLQAEKQLSAATRDLSH